MVEDPAQTNAWIGMTLIGPYGVGYEGAAEDDGDERDLSPVIESDTGCDGA